MKLLESVSKWGTLRRQQARARLRYAGVNTAVSPNDLMYKHAPAHYFDWGRGSLERVQMTLSKAGKEDVHTILDLPCGHGRELRYFRKAFPSAQIMACDVDRDAVDFCVKTFGVRGAYSHAEPAEIGIGGRFDLIWCGSLLTHVDSEGWEAFLKFFSSRLGSGGVFIFSTHGKRSADYFRNRSDELGILPEDTKRMFNDYELRGFGYANYINQRGNGFSFSSPGWVRAIVEDTPGIRMMEYVEGGWFDFQDTVACVPKN